jgi:hypothetical protein
MKEKWDIYFLFSENKGNDFHVISNLLVLFTPKILFANLLFFLRSEVILDAEGVSDFLRRLALNHVGNGLASDIKKRLNVEEVGSNDELKENRLLDAAELLVPIGNIVCSVLIFWLLLHSFRVVSVIYTILNNLLQDLS